MAQERLCNCPHCSTGHQYQPVPGYRLARTTADKPDSWYAHDNPSLLFQEARCEDTGRRFWIEFRPTPRDP